METNTSVSAFKRFMVLSVFFVCCPTNVYGYGCGQKLSNVITICYVISVDCLHELKVWHSDLSFIVSSSK